MSHKAELGFARDDIPEAQLGIPRGTQGESTVGTDDHIADKVIVSPEGALGVAVALGRVRQVPHDDGFVAGTRQENVGIFGRRRETGDPVAVPFQCSAERETFRHDDVVVGC